MLRNKQEGDELLRRVDRGVSGRDQPAPGIANGSRRMMARTTGLSRGLLFQQEAAGG